MDTKRLILTGDELPALLAERDQLQADRQRHEAAGWPARTKIEYIRAAKANMEAIKEAWARKDKGWLLTVKGAVVNPAEYGIPRYVLSGTGLIRDKRAADDILRQKGIGYYLHGIGVPDEPVGWTEIEGGPEEE